MSTLYLVRCNYADPQSEEDWSTWYSGAKQDWLLSRPGFVAGQRFRAVESSDGVRFAALYVLDSPSALQTPEYLSGWGWLDWRPNIIDWTRNFFQGVQPDDFLLPSSSELLRIVFVDSSADEALARAAYPGAMWFPASAGLDETLRTVGVERVTSVQQPIGSPASGVEVGVFEAVSPARISASD